MKKTKLTFLLALLLISCSENEMKDNGLNNEDTIIVDQEDLAIVGQWMLSSSSGRLTDASTTSKSFEEVCNIDSIIFQEDNSFKIYTNDEDGISNYVIFGNYSIDTENDLVKKLTSIANDISVIIKTDEYGVFMEVVNWEEVRDYLTKVTETLKEELKDVPNYEQIIANVMSIYSTKESIEANAVKITL